MQGPRSELLTNRWRAGRSMLADRLSLEGPAFLNVVCKTDGVGAVPGWNVGDRRDEVSWVLKECKLLL